MALAAKCLLAYRRGERSPEAAAGAMLEAASHLALISDQRG
ncbi:hypothetical protein YIM73518_18050 [Thermus brockianus]